MKVKSVVLFRNRFFLLENILGLSGRVSEIVNANAENKKTDKNYFIC